MLSRSGLQTVFLLEHRTRIRGEVNLQSDANCKQIVQSCLPMLFSIFLNIFSKRPREKKRSQRQPVREAVEFGGSPNLLRTACCSAPPCDCPLGGAGARSHAPTHFAGRAQFRSRRYELFGEE